MSELGWRPKGLIGVFALCLLGVWFVPGDAPSAQNREAREFPTFSPTTVLEASTFAQVDEAFRDRIGAQVAVSRAVGAFSVGVLGKSPTSSVILASDGQPFLGEDFARPCRETSTSLQILRDQLVSDAKTLNSAGKYVLYVVAPDKSSIRREAVDAISTDLLRCSDTMRGALQGWSDSGSVPILSLWDEVSELDVDDNPAYVFNDTHWNARGAVAMTTSVLNRLVDDHQVDASILADLRNPVLSQPTQFVSDMNLVMGLPVKDDHVQASFTRTGVTTVGSTTDGPLGPQLHYVSTSTGAALVPGRTLILGDSFLLTQVASQLPNFFEDVTISEHHQYAQAGQYDRVIVERVQRYAGSGDWPPLASTITAVPSE